MQDDYIQVGVGVGEEHTSAFAAGAAAAQQALAQVDLPIAAVLVFASWCEDLEALLKGIGSVVGQAPVVGATTAGEISTRGQHNRVVVTALASRHLKVRAGVGKSVAADWRAAVAQATTSPDLVRYFSAQQTQTWNDLTFQGKSAFALLFSPGNTRHADSRSYEILEELKQLAEGRLPIVGGATADNWQMAGNAVFCGQQVYPDGLLVVVFETQLRVGSALAHGFTAGEQRVVVTRADQHTVLELNQQPAAKVYADLLGEPASNLEGRHLTLTTGRPVGCVDAFGHYTINPASYFTAMGGVRFAQPVTDGTSLTIMEADPDRLITAGTEAVRKAILHGSITQPAGVLVFSCALRAAILGDRTHEEIDAMRALLPDVPLAGFYSFGEQGLADDGVNRHNNAVIAVLVLGNELSAAAQVANENAALRRQLEQHVAELAAQQIQQRNDLRRFMTLLENVQMGVLVEDDRRRIMHVNQQFCDMFGIPAPEMVIGADCEAAAQGAAALFVNPDEFIACIQHRLDSGVTVRGDELYLLDGRIFERDFVPLVLGGVDRGNMWLYRDVTAQRRTQRALEASERRFRQMFERNRAVRLLIDPDSGQIIDANPAACDFYGYDRATLQAMTIFEINILDPPTTYARMQEARHERQTYFEFHHRLASGRVRDVGVFSSPVEIGDETYLYSIVTDITDRKQAEQQALALQLERERTQMLTSFIRDASHEFRTPLSVINTNIYLMERFCEEETFRKLLARTENQVFHIAELVDALVTVTQLDAGVALRRETLNFNRLLYSLGETLRAAKGDQMARLVIELDADTPTLDGDFEFLSLAFRHLLDNAIRHTPPDSQITLRTECNQDHLVISISDTGPGIAPEVLSRIFDRFYRGDTAHSTRGFGLGLPIARGVIELHGGQLGATSILGQGSIFTATLPLPELDEERQLR